MIKEKFNIEHIPAVLWGKKTNNLIIAVHGNLSNKEDAVIAILAEAAALKGYQVLSFDLPDHGERKGQNIPCKVQNAVEDLGIIMDYAKGLAEKLNLFTNSMGTYFSLIAYKDVNFKQALFLSPLVDMERMIKNMMTWFNVSEERLKEEKEIPTPIGQSLYWDYYCYVKERPVIKWNVPTNILYGTKDDTVEFDTVEAFAKRFHADLSIMKDGEHYFHTEEQLSFFRKWCESCIKAV